MFQSEAIREVFNSIRQNKIRTILAGFGVAWGIFILVILLGVGQGFQNGVMSMFDIFAQKSMYVYGNRTSLKYRNMKEGMEVLFDKEYLHALHKRYAAINAISPEIMQPNMGITYKEKIRLLQLPVWNLIIFISSYYSPNPAAGYSMHSISVKDVMSLLSGKVLSRHYLARKAHWGAMSISVGLSSKSSGC